MNSITGYKSFSLNTPGSLMNSIMPELRDSGFFFVRTGERLYYRVDNYLIYSSLITKVPPRERVYDELVPEHLHQKPRFDIDIELPRDEKLDYVPIDGPYEKPVENIDTSLFQECLDALIDVLLLELRKLNLTRDIIVTTSHGADGDHYKISGHVIVDNYCHLTSREADYFGRKVIAQLPEHLQEYFDDSIWSPNHCLRMINNTKVGKTRYKTFQEKWNYRDKEIVYEYREASRNEHHKLNLQLEASLITVARKCKVIVVDMPEKVNTFKSYGDLSESQQELALQLFNEWWDNCPGTRTRAFKATKSEGSFITLARKYSSRCPICHSYPTTDRHTSNGAYILVRGDLESDRLLEVKFGCFSSKSNKKTMLIGTISNTEIIEIKLTPNGEVASEEHLPPVYTINPKIFMANGVDPDTAKKLSEAYNEITEDTPVPIGGYIEYAERKKTKAEIREEENFQQVIHTPGPTLEQVETDTDKAVPKTPPVVTTNMGIVYAPENPNKGGFRRTVTDNKLPQGISVAPLPPTRDASFLKMKR